MFYECKAKGRRVAVLGCAGLVCLLTADVAWSHDARPLSIMVEERQARVYRVDLRIPPSVELANQPDIVWPDGCAAHSGDLRQIAGVGTASIVVSCRTGLEGQRIGIHYPLFNPSISTLIRFSPAAGVARTAVLPPDQSEWLIPPGSNWRTVARDYLLLGIEHIWAGIDHLLFVAGLLMLAKTARRIAVGVTGFTIAHSVTLSLSALGDVNLPLPPIEAAIALSILFLAHEVARPNTESLARRFPLAIASFFGLLHGFGFAAALSEAGLPQGEIASALLFFNAGVEVGQLAFIAVVLSAIAAARTCAREGAFSSVRLTLKRAEGVGGYVLGVPASFWLFERLQTLWMR